MQEANRDINDNDEEGFFGRLVEKAEEIKTILDALINEMKINGYIPSDRVERKLDDHARIPAHV